MKAVILTQYFPPEIGAAQNRLLALARAFKERNHDVTVLTSLPNYPTGNIFDKYRHCYKTHEEMDGIKVIRCWLYVHKSRGTIPTVLSYLTFALTAWDVGRREIKGADLILWEYPPLFLGYTAMKLAKLWNAKMVTNIADLWTKSIREHKIITSNVVLKRFERYESKIFDKSFLITGQTDGILADILSKTPSSSPILWANGADINHFYPRPKKAELSQFYNPKNKFIIGYAGLHGRNHNLNLILEAANLLREEKDILFLLIGDGYKKRELQAQSKALKLPNLHFHDPVPYESLPEILALFDIGLVIHKPLPGLKIARSAKLFDLMAVGIPVLHCAESEGAEIIRQADAGKVVVENDPREVSKTILEMKASQQRERWGQSGREYTRMNFDRQKISVDIIKKIEESLLSS
jgi:glycosyltransferase involved in cell wall biosynthesis